MTQLALLRRNKLRHVHILHAMKEARPDQKLLQANDLPILEITITRFGTSSITNEDIVQSDDGRISTRSNNGSFEDHLIRWYSETGRNALLSDTPLSILKKIFLSSIEQNRNEFLRGRSVLFRSDIQLHWPIVSMFERRLSISSCYSRFRHRYNTNIQRIGHRWERT